LHCIFLSHFSGSVETEIGGSVHPKYSRIKENIALVSLNEKYQTILPENNFKICGLVKNIISTI
jgi:SOS-response transcriptional repressor LexA